MHIEFENFTITSMGLYDELMDNCLEDENCMF